MGLFECVDTIVDNYCQCYQWERKVTALLSGIVIAVGLAFILFLKTTAPVTIIVIVSILSFLIISSMTYVLSSESFWATPCDYLKNPQRIYAG